MLWGGLVLLAGLTVVVIAGPQLAPHGPFTTQGMVYADGDFRIPPFAPGAESIAGEQTYSDAIS